MTPAKLSLFDVFSLKQGWSIDPAALKHTYYRLMKEVHPDAVSPIAQPDRQEMSGFLNKAYRKMKSDYLRSVYLYSLQSGANLVDREFRGVNRVFGLPGEKMLVVDTERDRVPGCDKKLLDSAFLDSILYLEEQIEASAPGELADLKKLIAEKIDLCKKNSADTASLLKWKYYLRLLELADHRGD